MLGWFRKKKKKKTEPPALVCNQVVAQEEAVTEVNIAAPEIVASTPVTSSSSGDQDQKQDLEAEPVSEAMSEANLKTHGLPDDGEGVSEKKKGLFHRLRQGLSKTRESFVKRVDSIFLGKKIIDADLLDELEEILFTSDLGVKTTHELLDEAKARVKRKELSDPQILKEFIKNEMLSYLQQVDKPAELSMPENGPFVILVLGVNGVGKTTTIGKLANKFKKSGNKVLMVAADTFRAAAIDQIKVWGERIGVEVSAQQPGADPSSVAFDALEYARNRDFDVIIIDTAGRLHTKVNLMEELRKIKRVIGKKCDGAPHEVLLVLDATTGQNAISQAKLFNEAAAVTGLALTKLDGTAKGGIVVNISRELGIPIRFIGVGEQMDDLRDFEPQEFVEALFN